jgi:rod shape determining protein RodA
MNIRIMPVTGVPLPLLSYGGSSVLGSLIAIGLLQNVYIYRKAY